MTGSNRRGPPRRKAAARRPTTSSPAALRKAIRPIVEKLVAEALERLEDRLDAQDAAEALSEPGGISHSELCRKLGR